MSYYPDEVLEKIFNSVTSNQDRNSISLVSKSWFKVERLSRQRVFIGNCYSVSPERVIARFPKAKALSLKGRPRFANFDSVPRDWGGFALPWIQAMAKSCPGLEELRLKRMVVSDESLHFISRAFGNFKSLVLVSCQGFTTDGLAAIAANCRFLRELDLQRNHIEDSRGHWLSCFPETYTSLVSLNFACLKGQVDSDSLEKLVVRCPNLKQLKVNHTVPIRVLLKILKCAPQLEDLGIGLYMTVPWAFFMDIKRAIGHCKWIKSLSGIFHANKVSLSLLYPICENLTTLNLRYAPGISEIDFIELIQHGKCLQRLWVLDSVGDKGLGVVGSNCKELRELKVFPSPYDAQRGSITEEGLVAVSIGCSKLHSLQYFCQRMTNAALITVAKNCPNFTRFRICMPDPQKPDHDTLEPLDEGFGAIIQSCKSLKRLSLSGFLTEQVFLYIGMYGEQLEVLSVAFAGGSSIGMQYVLKGCRNLRKLEIKNSHFGDDALLEEVGKYERMRSLWMASCDVTLGGCKSVAKKMATLNLEIINEMVQAEENFDDTTKVEKIYMYRTLAGPRRDAPEYVWNL